MGWVKGRVYLDADENGRFSDTVADKLVGTYTKDGWLILSAELDETHQRISMIVTKNIVKCDRVKNK